MPLDNKYTLKDIEEVFKEEILDKKLIIEESSVREVNERISDLLKRIHDNIIEKYLVNDPNSLKINAFHIRKAYSSLIEGKGELNIRQLMGGFLLGIIGTVLTGAIKSICSAFDVLSPEGVLLRLIILSLCLGLFTLIACYIFMNHKIN